MLTLRNAVSLFLGEHIPSTRKTYNYNLQDLIAYIGEARPLNEIKAEDLIRFSQYFRNKPGVKSPRTYNKCVKTMRTFFNWCIKTELILPPSPAKAVKVLRHSVTVARDKAMPDEVYAKLVDFASGDARAYALVLFLGDGGGRIGGAAGLKWDDIDFTQKRALVTEKGQPARLVFFKEECCRALLRWQQHQASKRKPGGDYVFSVNGLAIKNESLGDYFKRTCVSAGLKMWGPHSLRHRKGFQLADHRVSPTTGAQLMGHTDIKMLLENYYPKDWDRVQQAVEELGYDPKQPVQLPRIFKDDLRTG